MDYLINKQQCGLCMLPNRNLIDIHQENENLLPIITKHFWFLIIDQSFQNICLQCWTSVNEFHVFYKTIETTHQNSFQFQSNDSRTQFATAIENTLTIIKCETLACLENDTINNEFNDEFNEFKVDLIDDFDCDDNKEEIFENFYNDDASLADEKDSMHVASNNVMPIIVKVTSSGGKKRGRPSGPSIINKPKPKKKDYKPSKSIFRDEDTDAKIKFFFKMECEVCGIGFETYLEAKRHYRVKHQQAGYISCCGKKFFRRFKIINHIMQHVNPSGHLSCDICQKTFNRREAVKGHMEMHVPQQNRPYKCAVCTKPKGFMSQFKLSQHMQLRHCTENDKKFECNDCHRRFPIKSILNAHVRNVHQNLNTQICDICAIVFKNKYTLKQHKIDVHNENSQPKVQCDACGTWLKNANNLRKHKNVHCDKTNVEEVHKCTECGKICTTKGSLLSHKNYVHSDRKYNCTLCEKAFKKPTGLKEHMATHTGEDIYTCFYCPCTFKSNANMHSHRKKSHPDEWLRDRKNKHTPIIAKEN